MIKIPELNCNNLKSLKQILIWLKFQIYFCFCIFPPAYYDSLEGASSDIKKFLYHFRKVLIPLHTYRYMNSNYEHQLLFRYTFL